MKSQKTTLIKPKKTREKENKKLDIIGPIIMMLIGIILFTDSSKAVIIVCYSIGAVIIAFGIYELFSYYRLKQELNIEDSKKLMLGVCTIFIGVLVIILSGAIETFLRFILGIALMGNGLKKSAYGLGIHNNITLLEGIIFIGIGLYTILAENIVFQVIGILLIVASIVDIITCLREKK